MVMAVVKMNKFTLLTLESFKAQLLKRLQIFEGVHFENLQEDDLSGDIGSEALEFLKKDSNREEVSMYEGELAKIKFAAEKIRPYVVKPGGLKGMSTPPDTLSFEEFDSFIKTYDYNATYESLKKLDEELKAVKAEKNKLKTDNANLKSWLALDISTKEMDQLKSVSYFLGIVNKTPPDVIRETIEGNFSACYLEIISTSRDETFVLCAVPAESAEDAFTQLKGIGFAKTNVGLSRVPAEQVAANEAREEALEREEEKLTAQVAAFADEHKKLDVALDSVNTELARARASDNFLALEHVVVISGWVPEEDIEKLTSIVSGCCGDEYYLEAQAVEKDSLDVPIKLKNNRVVAAFEDITSMYALPRYNEVDPTPLHAPFYIAFFGIMLGDAGYGLVLLIASLLVTKKVLHMSRGVTRFMDFMFYLSLSTIAVGFLYGSFFGFPFFTPVEYVTETGEVARKAIIDGGLDIVNMIVYSVVIGVAQILFGLCIKGYALIVKEGKPLDALFDSVFWILVLVGGIGMLLGVALPGLPPMVFQASKWLFIAMIVALTLTQGREYGSIGTKLAGGLFGVYGLTSYVGDFVSYTRLVALALSGAYIAQSFNMMAGLVIGTDPSLSVALIFKVIFGAIIFLFGALLNIGLSTLGAYVHTCRLQYVEYFGKFFEGGGKPFKAFKLMNETVKIKL